MTPRTRTSNQDASFKVYYSKKVPKQVYFPHRRKIVREKPTTEQDAPEPRQLTFLPEKMRRRSTIADSEDEEEEEFEQEKSEAEKAKQSARKFTSSKAKKHKVDVKEDEQSDEELLEPSRPTPKRRKKVQESRQKATPKVLVKLESNEDFDSSAGAEHSASEEGEEGEEGEKDEKFSRRKRQSTMTQLVEGRRPSRGGKEPEFKPVGKRRTSGSDTRRNSKRKEQNKKQRTLTQMVPGLVPIGLLSDDDDMEDEEDDIEQKDQDLGAIKQIPTPGSGRKPSVEASIEEHDLPTQSVNQVVDEEDDESQEYQPTQFIDAPALSRKRSSRRSTRNATASSTPTSSTPRKASKSRFSLLATPERRKIMEIPSSQSPPTSPLSTQVTPSRAGRQPLSVRTSNLAGPSDTPSKKKQVTFQDEVKNMPPPPLPLRKFGSVIEDSEEEEDDLLDEDVVVEAQDVGPETQALIRRIGQSVQGKNIGAETQAILDEIDQACASVENDGLWHNSEVSDDDDLPTAGQAERDPSEELGERRPKELDVSQHQLRHTKIKAEPQEASLSDLPEAVDFPRDIGNTVAQHLSHPDSPESNLPSSPLVIKDESDSENEDPAPTPPRFQASTDLDGELIHVPRSPTPARPETQETIRSHTSKAEQQLQSEWKSYSQYRRAPLSSSMHVAHDSIPFSYQATPHGHPARSNAEHRSLLDMSQATTVDFTQSSPKTTPKKPRSRNVSAKTTPHKIASSQPLISPAKPPPLFIPSSFPSPGRAGYGEWSSPVIGRDENINGNGRGFFTQIGSVEDFSIPPLPPVDDDDMFEG